MKSINISLSRIDEKEETIMATLGEVQKRCTARTIDSFEAVKGALAKVSDDCPVWTKSGRVGIHFVIDVNGQNFPSSYTRKGRPESTIISGNFTKTGMKIEFVRDWTKNGPDPEYSGFSCEQMLTVLKQAGADTYYISKAMNLYENSTGKIITG